VKSFPIGIDAREFQKAAARPRQNRIIRLTLAGLGRRKLIIGVDRLGYSSIPQRMEAYTHFLFNNPDQRGQVAYLSNRANKSQRSFGIRDPKPRGE